MKNTPGIINKKRVGAIAAYVVIILVIVGYFAVDSFKRLADSIADKEKKCLVAINNTEDLLATRNRYEQAFERFTLDDAVNCIGILAASVENNDEDYQTLLEKLRQIDVNAEVITDNGESLATQTGIFPEFSKEQLETLASGNVLKTGGSLFIGYKTDKFLMILKLVSPEENENETDDFLRQFPEYIFISDKENGRIIASNAEIVGNNVNELKFVKTEHMPGTECRKGRFIAGGNLFNGYRFVEKTLPGNITVCSFFPEYLIQSDIFFTDIVPFVVSLIFALVILGSCLNNPQFSQIIKTGANNVVAVRVSSMIGICALIALAFSAYFIFLPSVSDISRAGKDALNSLKKTLAFSASEEEKMRKKYEEQNFRILFVVDYLLSRNNGVADEQTFGKIEKILQADAITIFDSEGSIEFDTRNSTPGYRLSADPEDEEYVLWKLLKGERGKKAVYLSDGTGKVYFAVSRSDKVGMIRLTISDSDIISILKRYDSRIIMSSLSYPDNSILIFGKADDTTHLTCYDTATGTFYPFDEPISENVFENGFDGIESINGKKYFFTTKYYNDEVFVFGNSGFHFMIKNCCTELACIILLYFLISLTVIKLSGISPVNIKTNWLYEDSPKTSSIKQFTNKTIHKVFIATLFAVLILVIVYSSLLRTSENSGSLIFGDGQGGLSVWTVTFTLFIMLITFFISKGIGWIFRITSRCVSDSNVSIVQLLSNILQVAVYLFAVIICLKKFNIPPVQLATLLGVGGIAIGFGAQDIINDLLAGAFLILEHRINIGDYIKVDDFFGQVSEINMRTTKIQNDNEVISVNNSNMRNIINASSGYVPIKVDLVISFSNNVRDFISLIENNSKRYIEADVNNILKKTPFSRGIAEYGTEGIKVSVESLAEVSDSSDAEYLIRNVTLQLIIESNIKLPDDN